MPDFRVADTAPEHRKLRAAGLPAAGLWALAGAWSMGQLTDGWVPAYWVGTWPAGMRHAATLVRVGLWTPETVNGFRGFRFHEWTTVQRTRDEIETEREKARERMRELRAAGSDVRPNKRRTSPARSRNVHDSLSLSQEGGSFSSSPTDRTGATAPPFDPDVARRGAALVRSELEAARAKRDDRQAGAS